MCRWLKVERDRRWPRAVYGVGEEPDPRFTLANERTFLAWVRTSLALLAAGVVLDAVTLPMDERLRRMLAGALTALAAVGVVAAWWRWVSTERALRQGRRLPGAGLGAVIAAGVALVAVGIAVVLAVR